MQMQRYVTTTTSTAMLLGSPGLLMQWPGCVLGSHTLLLLLQEGCIAGLLACWTEQPWVLLQTDNCQ
jgi:hypothetical protein